ncbi:MAG: hypothetical protein V4736_07755, partial [Bdellovibrionota bacterium]
MKKIFLALALTTVFGCSESANKSLFNGGTADQLYATKAVEREVSFEALLKTSYTDLETFRADNVEPSYELKRSAEKTLQFIYGPLVVNDLGSPQKGETIEFALDQARMEGDVVAVPYVYKAKWMLRLKYRDLGNVNQPVLEMPIPF